MSHVPAARSTAPEGGAVVSQCGRCRKTFEGAASADFLSASEWWLCAECEQKLLPRRSIFLDGGAQAAQPG